MMTTGTDRRWQMTMLMAVRHSQVVASRSAEHLLRESAICHKTDMISSSRQCRCWRGTGRQDWKVSRGQTANRVLVPPMQFESRTPHRTHHRRTFFSCARHFVSAQALTQDELSTRVCNFSQVILSSQCFIATCSVSLILFFSFYAGFGNRHNLRRSTERFSDSWFGRLAEQSPLHRL